MNRESSILIESMQFVYQTRKRSKISYFLIEIQFRMFVIYALNLIIEKRKVKNPSIKMTTAALLREEKLYAKREVSDSSSD